jgi:hypothetical protein
MAVDIPSWVPDWSANNIYPTYVADQFATGMSRVNSRHGDSNEPNVLHALGVCCDTVTSVASRLPNGLDSASAISHIIKQWRPHDLDTTVCRPTGETLKKAYAITLSNYAVRERWPDFNYYDLVDLLETDWANALLGKVEERDDDVLLEYTLVDDVTPEIRSEVNRALMYCKLRSLIWTAEGYIGLAPGDTQIGLWSSAYYNLYANS